MTNDASDSSERDPYKWSNGRLREEGVERIHDLCESGMTYQKIAEALQICSGTVYNVVNGRTWPEVKARRDAKKQALTLSGG